MPTLIRVTAIMPYQSGLPRDVSENVWHFGAADADAEEAMFTYWAPRLQAFYDETVDGLRISGFLGNVIDRTAARLVGRVVNIATGVVQPTGPETTLPLGALVGTDVDLPLEVALCASFKNTLAITDPPGRRRGRVYIGPLNSSIIEVGADLIPRPTDAVMDRLTAGVETLANAGQSFGTAASNEGDLVIYSRVANGFYVVNAGWCDDELDTQRRRQADPTHRSTFTAT